MPPNANCAFCHILWKEQRETALLVQNNSLTVSGSYSPCRPNLPTPVTGGGAEKTAMHKGSRGPVSFRFKAGAPQGS